MFLRSEDQSLELAVHADPRSEVRAHGDGGRGSFDLSWRGNVLVRAPGSILSSSHPRSAWSRSGSRQNVTCLNALPPAVSAKDRVFVPAEYTNRGGTWMTCTDGLLEFRWNGFERIRDGIILRRTWRLSANNGLSVDENVDGTGTVQFESRLWLGDALWERSPFAHHGHHELHREYADGPVNLTITLPQGVHGRLEEGTYFPEFGVESKTAVFVFCGTARLPIHWTATWQFCTESLEQTLEASQQCAG
jgi:hypothetical protein